MRALAARYRRTLLLLACLTVLLSPCRLLWAATFPQPLDDYVNDYAGVMGEADRTSVRGMLERVRSQSGRHIAVVTVDSLADYADPGQSLESYAAGLFDSWGIGRKDVNDGVLVFFARADRRVRIELGAGYGGRYDAAMQAVVDERMLPYFRQGEYGRGLYEGTRSVVEALTTQVSWFRYYRTELILGALAVVCVLAGISCIRSGKKGWGWVFFTVAGTLILTIVMLLFRRKRGKGSGFGGGHSGGGGASGSW